MALCLCFRLRSRQRLPIKMTYNINNRTGHKSLTKLFYENGSIYVLKPEILIKLNNRLGGNISTYMMESWQRADIDDVETLDWCKFCYQKYLN